MKKYIRKDDEAVSPVIAVILMVAITVVLSGVLWAMLSNLGAKDTGAEVKITTRSTGKGSTGWLISIVSVSGDLKLDDAKFRFIDGSNIQIWQKTISDASPKSISSSNSTVYAIPSTAAAVRDNSTGITIVDDSDPKNYELAYIVYIDSNSDGKVSEGDGIWVYKDYNTDGTIDYSGLHTLEIKTANGKLAGRQSL